MARSTYVSEGADTRLHCALRARPRLVEDRVVFRYCTVLYYTVMHWLSRVMYWVVFR